MSNNQPSQVRTRFAPSPTGYLHVGGARTALFNWLFARQQGGSFVLRIEDTDQARNTEEARAAIFQGMQWLGLDWDEGPLEDGSGKGDHGPYFQSQRKDIYDKWFAKLIDADRVYEDEGAWRFRFERKPVTVNDQVCGDITIDYRDESNTPDMVIKRSDGSYVFHFVNVVDDLEMQISHVIRGEDHLMNTPKHLQLFEAFNTSAPIYAHIPLLLNMDGSKMSKRDTGAAVGGYSEEGYLPHAVFNFLALLGWSPKDDSEIMQVQEITSRFSLAAVNRSPAKFDTEKCLWLNQQHLMAMNENEFAQAAAPFVKQADLPQTESYPAIAASVQQKVQRLKDVPDAISFYLDAGFPYDQTALDKLSNNPEAKNLLQSLAAAFEQADDWQQPKDIIATVAQQNDAKPGQLMFPTRVALSGQAGGPDLGAMMEILGQDECVARIQRIVNIL